MFESRIVPCSTYPATVPGGHSTVISWFRHGQQTQLSHLEGLIEEEKQNTNQVKSNQCNLHLRGCPETPDSPEWPVRLDDDLVAAVGDGHLEGALLVAALELFGFSIKFGH